jgi:transcriptional regulator with XRE-family HTH domain
MATAKSDSEEKLPIAGLVRRARRIADLSQREMAIAAGTSRATVGKVEAGLMVPSLGLFVRMVAAAGLWLSVVDGDGHVVQPMDDLVDTLDGAERRYPSHLDTILDPRTGEWWADQYGLTRPPETFRRDRAVRDAQRLRSQWEVRVAKYRHDPPPPMPYGGRWRVS